LVFDAGALHFRGFSASRTKPGFRRFCEALPLQPCTDPLASIGVRSLLSKDEGVYEAVNAQVLALALTPALTAYTTRRWEPPTRSRQ
jgi:hypothetical protein